MAQPGFLYGYTCVEAEEWQHTVLRGNRTDSVSYLVGRCTEGSGGSHQAFSCFISGSEGWNGMRSKREAVRRRRTRGAENLGEAALSLNLDRCLTDTKQ
jgi:hypothetical protein